MSEISMQSCIMKCTNAVQLYLVVINEMHLTSQPFLMKCTKALQMYLRVINEMYLTSLITVINNPVLNEEAVTWVGKAKT